MPASSKHNKSVRSSKLGSQAGSHAGSHIGWLTDELLRIIEDESFEDDVRSKRSQVTHWPACYINR